MSKRVLSLVFLFLAIAVLMIIESTRESSAAVLMPSELAKRGELLRVRVAGKVVEPIEYKTVPEIELRFRIVNPGPEGRAEPVAVVHHDLKPDMFAPGRDVIIDGEYRNGVLHAAKLMTQCPSKYEPPDPGALYSNKEANAALPKQ